MLTSVLEVIRGDAHRAAQVTSDQSFQRAAENLSEAISLTESRAYEQAAERVGMAISQVTTPAQTAWEALAAHGFV